MEAVVHPFYGAPRPRDTRLRPIFTFFEHEICEDVEVLDAEEIGVRGTQKRMRIIISQDDDAEEHIKSRRGVLGYGVGSSDIAEICNFGMKALVKHFWEYLVWMPPQEFTTNDPIDHGNHFEGLVRCVYEMISCERCYDGNMWRIYTPWIAELFKDEPKLAFEMESCSPDATLLFELLIDDATTSCIDKVRGGVEFKAPYGDLYPDIPIYHLFQVMWQIYTLNVPFIDYCAVKIGRLQDEENCGKVYAILWIRVHRSAPFIKRMLAMVQEFLHCVIERRKPSWGEERGTREEENEWRGLARNELKFRGECPSDIAENAHRYWERHRDQRQW